MSSALPSQSSSISISISSSIATSSSPTARPVVILPGLGNNSKDYEGMTWTLRERYGIPSVVVSRVSRLDWFRNATGLLDPNYWKGTLQPSPVLDWYLHRVQEAISEVTKDNRGGNSGGISLIGHSAGGWLARLYMEQQLVGGGGGDNISLLLTLGSPHLPPPKGVPGVIDQTRGLLDYVNNNCKPAVYTPQLRYVCVAGRYIRGARLVSSEKIVPAIANDDQGTTDNSMGTPPTIRARFIGQGYKQVCGQADVWGDGVVPEVSAHLDGALNVTLDGVYHSPVGSDDVERPWYGSPPVVQKWIHHLLT